MVATCSAATSIMSNTRGHARMGRRNHKFFPVSTEMLRFPVTADRFSSMYVCVVFSSSVFSPSSPSPQQIEGGRSGISSSRWWKWRGDLRWRRRLRMQVLRGHWPATSRLWGGCFHSKVLEEQRRIRRATGSSSSASTSGSGGTYVYFLLSSVPLCKTRAFMSFSIPAKKISGHKQCVFVYSKWRAGPQPRYI